MLFIQCKNCMATSESKGRFFYKTNKFESIRITNRTESIRIAIWNALERAQALTVLQYSHRRFGNQADRNFKYGDERWMFTIVYVNMWLFTNCLFE